MNAQENPPTVQPSRIKVNMSSNLLTAEENESVFRLLGRKCQTLSTAVVQIYKTEPSAHSHWKKKHTGVVCFVKDSGVRSYFLRAYCLLKHELIWQHEIYDDMKLAKSRPFLLTFEGEDGHVGLNFVSEEECDAFHRAVTNTIETRNRKRMEKRRPKSQNAPALPPPREPPKVPPSISETTSDNTDNSAVQMRNSKLGTVRLTPAPAPPATSAPAPSTTKNSPFSGFGLNSSSNKKKGKVAFTKADISTPTNFVHVSHVGWDANKGFDLTGNENDEVLNHFFAKAGVSENELKDRDTRAFIYDFIQSNNVLASVKKEAVKPNKAPAPPAMPPPVPSRHHGHQNGTVASQRTAPPPPPMRQKPPPVPKTIPGQASARGPPPSRPPPPPTASNVSAPSAPPPPPPPPPPMPSSSAPPPPPPPMPTGGMPIPTITTTNAAPTKVSSNSNAATKLPVVSDSRSALMDAIRKGTQLKKVDASSHSTGSADSRSDLMLQIREGFELKPAQNRDMPPPNRGSGENSGTDALADALRRALSERGRAIQSSDDESESSVNDDEWDD